MKYREELHWILDKPGTTIHNQEAEFKESIAFVHSLGKKCDCVGWSRLRREDPDAEEILQKIAAFCTEKGWTARGLYIRTYADFDTDWYAIDGAYFQDHTVGESVSIPAQDGGSVKLCSIKAYRELTVAPKSWGHNLYVPECFCKAYREMGLTGMDFCWARDTGKYTAQQYFVAFGTQRIPRVAVGWDLGKQDLCKLGPDGGWLPQLGAVFHKWTQLNLPYCYKKEDMPEGGIAYAYIETTSHCCGLHQILVHKEVAQKLLREKAIPAGALKPVPVLDEVLPGYTLRETSNCPRPTGSYMAQSLLDWEAQKKKARPVWQITEKEALKILRKAKADRKEDFGKKRSKAKAESLAGTGWEPMLPYYLISNGGSLSDEYRLLSAEESQAESKAFCQTLESEELLEEKPDGIVICTCADGDWVLLIRDGSVIRFSHEAPETTGQWPTLAQFIVDAVNS